MPGPAADGRPARRAASPRWRRAVAGRPRRRRRTHPPRPSPPPIRTGFAPRARATWPPSSARPTWNAATPKHARPRTAATGPPPPAGYEEILQIDPEYRDAVPGRRHARPGSGWPTCRPNCVTTLTPGSGRPSSTSTRRTHPPRPVLSPIRTGSPPAPVPLWPPSSRGRPGTPLRPSTRGRGQRRLGHRRSRLRGNPPDRPGYTGTRRRAATSVGRPPGCSPNWTSKPRPRTGPGSLPLSRN